MNDPIGSNPYSWDITEDFSAESFQAGKGPLSQDFLDRHGFENVTQHAPWRDRFDPNADTVYWADILGCYYDSRDQYWIAREVWVVNHPSGSDRYILERIGIESDLLDLLELEDRRTGPNVELNVHDLSESAQQLIVERLRAYPEWTARDAMAEIIESTAACERAPDPE